MTDAERRLWSRLRDRRLGGHKFRRQVPIGPYVVDFACAAAKLVVEADGAQHLEETSRDAERTCYLAKLGYRVVRTGGTSGAVLNAANEALVEAFLQRRIRLTDIPVLVTKVLDRHDLIPEPDLADILAAANWAVNEVRKCIA